MTTLVPSDEKRLDTVDLLPPEKHYRPPGRSAALLSGSWILFVFMVIFVFSIIGFGSGFTFIAAVGGIIGFTGWRVLRVYRAAHENQRGVRLLVTGEVEEASGVFEELTRKHRYHPHHALFVHNRAVAYMMQGQHRRAFSLLNAARRSKRFRTRALRSVRSFPERNMALALALMGEVEAAKRFLREAEEQVDDSQIGYLVLPRSVLLLRTNRPGQALDYLVRHWNKAEGLASGTAIKTLRVVRAFARARAESPDHPEVRRMLDGVYPAEPDDFRWFCRSWPEMEQFCRQEQLI